MTEVAENWTPIWRGLAMFLLREGYCSMKSVERWAKDNKFLLPVVRRVIDALAIESFDHEGEIYFRLSGRVVPLVPRDVRDVRAYRIAGQEEKQA
jgi:hypothetical protein